MIDPYCFATFTHTDFSDGKLSVRELVDFYGQRAFDVLWITDHICDHTKLIGKMTNLTGLVLTLDQVSEYLETIASHRCMGGGESRRSLQSDWAQEASFCCKQRFS